MNSGSCCTRAVEMVFAAKISIVCAIIRVRRSPSFALRRDASAAGEMFLCDSNERIGSVCFSYTRVSWHSDRSHFSGDPYAFLFSFTSRSSVRYALLDRHSRYAVWNAPNYGPTFGRGADLFVCSQCQMIKESYSRLPSSYRDSTGLACRALTGQEQFFIEEIEVYH